MNQNKLKLELRIDWSELDFFGHVNNVAISKYIQSARVNLLERLGLMQSQYTDKIGPILASMKCQFIKPLSYPGQVILFAAVDQIKNTSFQIQYEIVNDKKEIISQAQDVIVLYDYAKNTKLAIPEDIRQKILELGK
ncbi:MAG: acyl-CoA thioesterase [Sphingobacteriales bacterium]|jgi:acyl-CoA thioester hydrolase|nr:acyl-CoA thioesterase [Sphingobacteriales bacterium]